MNDILKMFADNTILFEAVKKHILQFQESQVDTGMEDKRIGEIVRANIESKKRVELAFKDMEKFRTKETSEEKNPAR